MKAKNSPLPRLILFVLGQAFFWLLLTSVARFATYQFFFANLLKGESVTRAFWLGFRYDAKIISIFSLIVLVVGVFPWLHPFKTNAGKRVSVFLSMLFACVMITAYTADYFHLDYLKQRLNASVLGYLEDAKISMGMVWETYPVVKGSLGLLLLVILVIAIVNSWWRYVSKKQFDGKMSMILGSYLTLFVVLGVGAFGRIGQYPLRWSDAFSLGNDNLAHLALNPIQSFASSLKFRHKAFDIDKTKAAYPFMAGYLQVEKFDSVQLDFSRHISFDTTLKKPKNVVLVICESFSGYKSSMWGNPLDASPYFNQLSKQGVLFDRCFTPHYGTARGVWATLTGIPDVSVEKTASRNPQAVDQYTILQALPDFEKLYFIGGSFSWANIRGVLQNNINSLQLFEEGSYSAPKADVWGISDVDLFKEANAKLKNTNRPFFAIIQTANNHRPYTIPEEDQKAMGMRTVAEDSIKQFGYTSNTELNAFRYMDYAIQTFMEQAKKETYFKETLFVFIGDHGIRGNAGKMFPKTWTDDGLVCVHVPLLFYAPELLKPSRQNQVCSQVDVMPSIAGLLQMPVRNNTIGRNLFAPNGPEPLAFIMDHDIRQIGVVDGNYYYNRKLDGTQERLAWMGAGPSPALIPAGLKDSLRTRTTDFFETSRYLLLHNKKQ